MTFQNLYKVFENRKGNSIGLNQLLNLFYGELFGDCFQLLSMCNCYLTLIGLQDWERGSKQVSIIKIKLK